MRIERDPPEGSDEDVTRLLRELVAPPADAAYWSGLEQRIMTRVATGGAEWWSAFDGWVRIGLAAAVLAGLIAGSVAMRSRDTTARLAYEAVMESSSGVPVAGPTAMSSPSATTRDATLRFVMSY